MIQGTEKIDTQEKEFDLEDALTSWRTKVVELFPGQLFNLFYAGKHPELKESYIVQFDLNCLHCGKHSQQYQWLIQKNKICI